MHYASIGPIAVQMGEIVEDNEELAQKFPHWDLELIRLKTGIRVRYVAGPGQFVSDLGVAAAEKLFEEQCIERESIDFLLFCTQTPDYPLPTTACLVQERLGLRTSVGALDYNLGCSGFVYGLALADGLIRSGAARRILLITSETYSKYIDPGDRALRTIFSDAAAATLIDAAERPSMRVRDLSGLVQVVVEKAAQPEHAVLISQTNPESVLTITGKVIDNPVVKLGGLELQLETLRVDSAAAAPLPLDPTASDLPALDYRLDWRFLDLRRSENLLMFKVQTTVLAAMRAFWIEHGFFEMNSPKLMGSPSESGAELFEVPYFDRKAYLAQSPQFYKQMAMAAGWDGVFEIGPVFRADPSFTSRHMTEFTSVDMEMAHIESHEDVMSFQERWLATTISQVKEKHGDEIQQIFNLVIEVPTLPFPRVTMAKAMEILKENNYQVPAEKKGDIDPGGERVIGKWVKESLNHDFVFLTDWPISVRPFYHMRYLDRPGQTRSFDLLAKGLEITTGAQREHRYAVLAKQAEEKGLRLEPIQFYLDFFKYGCPPHGGFGFGLSRFMMILLDLANIRETVYLFRGPTRLHP